MNKRKIWRFWILLCVLMLTACKTEPEKIASTPQISSQSPTLTPTSLSPSATPVDLAAQVNGEGITMVAYQAEVERFRTASGSELTPDDQSIIINNMIDQLLLAQAASQAGFNVDEAMLQNRIQKMGISEQELQTWIESHGYTQESFEHSLRLSIAAAWMRDQIIAEVPNNAEQVHARQILLYNVEEAEDVLARLDNGADFATLAEQYAPVTLGDLGWFPRGYLTVPELDEVVFDLAPEEHSDIIRTVLGFHIVQVIERDAEHTLSPDSYRAMQVQSLDDWLEHQRAQNEIMIYLP
ncbi:MAG: peptidylprolyl isomerase [Chloroflexota bacterium]|nr:peptidylprolyl isomerase [Chloroflexota bacterium]